ncbi:antibiotic biosynthesis monooxygenase family protein [Limosilactobacillus ingluviei]|uniref:ABM domain-containing protein n=1 Tax=Limosilactobacillus ingluviei DSM 15946 TaxID=1423760 RepID=A0A0R1U616_9LACO|nr:hypothetical protein [Limosilactobacillus ingluviei]KRL88656.1 hypothetical protein FC43_GL000101 [Limosilactobacillus ingluviei DSM 15946]
MLNELSYTLGSRAYLMARAATLAPRPCKLYASSRVPDKYALFDFSGQRSQFAAPIRLKPITAVGSDEFRGLLSYQSFSFGRKDRKMLRQWASELLATTAKTTPAFLTGYLTRRKDDAGTLVLLTWWQTPAPLEAWLNSSAAAPLRQYAHSDRRGQYFSDHYRLVD